jgi:putative endopeptidase
VNGPFSDIASFYKDFDVKPGDKLYLPEEKRVTIW